MRYTMHTGVGLSYLLERVRELGPKQDLVTQEDKPIPWVDAVAWINDEMKAGKRLTSSCPTPKADGSCPGHPKEG